MMYITKNYHWNLHSELNVTGTPSLPTAAVGLIIEQNKKRPIYMCIKAHPVVLYFGDLICNNVLLLEEFLTQFLGL